MSQSPIPTPKKTDIDAILRHIKESTQHLPVRTDSRWRSDLPQLHGE